MAAVLNFSRQNVRGGYGGVMTNLLLALSGEKVDVDVPYSMTCRSVC